VGYDRGREVLETSLAQFQADRATVELARRYRSQAAALDEMSRALAAAPNRRVERRRTELVAEQSKLSNRIERRTGSIARAFDQTCAVLETLGYLARTRGGAPVVTEDGELLRRIYAENDMLFAQCLRLGVWAELDAPGLAAAVSAVAYSGRTESLGQPRVPGGSRGVLAQALSATTRVWSELTDVEEAHAVEVSEGLDFGLVTPVYRWARGDSLAEVLTEADLSAGDFVRWSKQIIDVLGQLTSAAPTPALRATAQAAADALLRGVVAYSAL
jgi:ATP-dependent RNA helicase HelY